MRARWARLPAISTSRPTLQEHPLFRREGDNIHINVPVTISEAGLGAKIEVPTIDGKTLLQDSARARRTIRSSVCASAVC